MIEINPSLAAVIAEGLADQSELELNTLRLVQQMPLRNVIKMPVAIMKRNGFLPAMCHSNCFHVQEQAPALIKSVQHGWLWNPHEEAFELHTVLRTRNNTLLCITPAIDYYDEPNIQFALDDALMPVFVNGDIDCFLRGDVKIPRLLRTKPECTQFFFKRLQHYVLTGADPQEAAQLASIDANKRDGKEMIVVRH